MASKVPQFGAWEGGENYTVYFENARKTKSNGKMINPNDPEENPEMFTQNMTPNQTPSTPSRSESQGQQSTKVPQFGAWENGEDDVGYTAYFENARKSKTSVSTKAENQAQTQAQTQAQAQTQTQGQGQGQGQGQTEAESRSKVPQFGDWNEGENVGYTAYFENPRKKKNNDGSGVELQLNRDVVDHPKAATKAKSQQQKSRDSPPSFDGSEAPSSKNGRQTPGGQTPQHPRGGAKTQSKPVSRGSQNSEKGQAIPPFGVWNTDPQAEGFTGAFIRAREDKNTPLHSSTPASRHNQTSKSDEPKKSWCFCCFG